MKTATAMAANLCREFEGFRERPYLCPAGVPTIGYGSTFYPDGRKVTIKDAPITREKAEEMLQHTLVKEFLPAVLRQCPNLATAAPERLAAILDWTYNLGEGNLASSTLRKKLLAEDWPAACTEILRWNKGPDRKPLPGLVRRREAEVQLIKETLP